MPIYKHQEKMDQKHQELLQQAKIAFKINQQAKSTNKAVKNNKIGLVLQHPLILINKIA